MLKEIYLPEQKPNSEPLPIDTSQAPLSAILLLAVRCSFVVIYILQNVAWLAV
jgi:hypothetical protein